MTDLQTDADGRLRHLLSLEGLPRPVLERLLDLGCTYAQGFLFGKPEALVLPGN